MSTTSLKLLSAAMLVALTQAKAQKPAAKPAKPAPPTAAAAPSAAAPAPAATAPVPEPQNPIVQKMEAAAAKQRSVAQSQTSPAPEGSFFSTGWAGPSILPPPPPPPPDCPLMQESEYDPLIRTAASRHQLNPDLVKAVMRQESGFKPCAVSEKGALGLMQLMPETADALKVTDPMNPAQNVEAGATYLKQMLGRFKGDLRLALAAYNAGPERVDGLNPAVPNIPETLEYVNSISKALNGAAAETTQ